MATSFSPVGDAGSVLYSTNLSKRVGMCNQRVGGLLVSWPDDAVIYAVDMLGSHDTKF